MTTPLDTALSYIQRGWNPVPVPYRSKIPTGEAWQDRVITADNASKYFNGGQSNIGVQEGPSSNGLTDADLDCPEAIAIAPYVLPSTNAIFGRKSKRASHWLYKTDLASKLAKATEQFKDPTLSNMLVELRIGGGGKGAQTVFPGSVHETGEPIEWDTNGEPASVNGKELCRRIRELAAYSLLARYIGNKHECALALGGFLARAGKTPAEAKTITEAIARAADDAEWDNRRQAAEDAAELHRTGGKTYGLPMLLQSLGLVVVSKAAEWLGYRGSKHDNNLPDLVIDDSNPTAVAKQLTTLIAARDEFLFNGSAPIRIAIETNRMPRALEVTNESVRVLAHEICNPIKKTKQGEIPVPLKNDIANLYLYGLEGRWGLKPFNGITTAPILNDDGSIRSASGYDAASGLWCHNIPILDIPLQPSGREAKAALERLRSTFRTFPFADSNLVDDPILGVQVIDPSKPSGLDESTFLATLLTAVCRQSLELAPGFLCDAPSLSGAGCGKGLLVKATCIIASGVRPSAFTSGHDAGEFDKRLTAALVEAHPAVFLDNFNAKELTSDILASVLTENPAKVRVMGQTKMVPLHVRTFIGITGNGIEIAEDMARRLLKCHLDAKMENPEERKFQPGFLDNILAQRATLLSDALTIWRWGRQNQGVLTAGRPLGSYETWCLWIRDPLLSLGMRDPVDRLAEIKAADPKRRALVAIFEAWWTSHQDQLLKAADLAPEVLEHIDARATRRADGTLQFSRQRVAGFLTKHAGTHVGGYVLETIPVGPPSKPVAHHRLRRNT